MHILVTKSPSTSVLGDKHYMVSIPSIRDRATVHQTVASEWVRIKSERKNDKSQKELVVFWSEWLDSNQRPLEPHSSAIPNFATPGYSVLPSGNFDILAHSFCFVNSYFNYFWVFIYLFDTIDVALSGRPSYGFDLHFHSLGNENKCVAAVETGGQQHAPGMLHLSGFESALKKYKPKELMLFRFLCVC